MLRYFFILLVCAYCSADIVEIQTTQNLLPELHQEGIVVFFDIDDTLMTNHYYAGQESFGIFLQDQFKEYVAKNGNPCGYDLSLYLKNYLRENIPVVPVEHTTADLIDQIREKGIPVFALTARREKYTLKPGMELDQRVITEEHLKHIGIELDAVFFSNGKGKGELINEIISTMSLSPNKIILVDDKIEQLQSMENAISDIPFTGYWYRATQNKNNFSFGMIQLSTFIFEGYLPTNEEVEDCVCTEPEIMFEKFLQRLLCLENF